MGQTAIIVPVKAGDRKKRLASILDEAQRKQLVIAMLEDVLQTLIKAKVIRDSYVVSSDRQILKLAENYEARSIQEEGDRGVNSAVKTAMASTSGYSSWMIIPADIPFIKARDIRNAIVLHRLGASVVISPSREFDGTNLLLLRKDAKMELHYDDDSFNRHTGEALANSLPMAMYYSDNVAFDIDRATDVHRAFRLNQRCSALTYLARMRRVNPKLRMTQHNVVQEHDTD
jgi:2-phospho-L-lactate guanylyltransferase